MPLKIGKIFRRHDKSQVTSTRQHAVPPGDIPKPLMPGRKVQPEEIRNLRELIRKRYALDVEIWDLRHVKPRDRHVVEDMMRRSDATLRKIYRTVCEWDSPNAFESQEDWAKLQDIKTRIEEGGKRFWADNPPWNEQILVDRSVGV
jgi:hypothetical protein